MILRELENDILAAVESLLRAGDLDPNSNAFKSIEVESGDGFINVIGVDYLLYIQSGRKSKSRKVPIRAIINWIRKKNLKTETSVNSLAYAIQRSIFIEGIPGKKIINEKTLERSLLPSVERVVEKMIEKQLKLK